MITIKAKKLSTILDKFFGLMFKHNIKTVYFETRFGIHTFFVKEPIDVIILDNNNLVKTMCEQLKPFRILIWNPKYNRVLELPKGFLKNNKITKGSIINLSYT